MKRLFLILLALIYSTHTFAECGMSGLSIYPKTKEISQSSLFLIEGYLMDQELVRSFMAEGKAFLETVDGERVELILEEILEGQMALTQALFRPNQELKLNETYFLKFSNVEDLERYHELTQYNPDKGERERVAWTVTKSKMKRIPKKMNLFFENTTVEYYGCGPAAYAFFDPENSGDEEIWFRTELHDKSNNSSRTYILTEWLGKIAVGHGMCSGGFRFNNEGEYKVRFTAMNIDGKKASVTPWNTFESPYKNSSDPFGL